MKFIIVSYLAGVLTILSPCILPILPFVFARSEKSFIKGTLPLLLGMSLTFAILSSLVIVGGGWLAHATQVGRNVALVFLGVMGLSLLFPSLSEKIWHPFAALGGRFGVKNQNESFMGSILVGASTGLLWAPCAGPVLGLVLAGAASNAATSETLMLLLAYSLGAATSLLLALMAGGRFLKSMKKYLAADRYVKSTLGVLVLLGVATVALDLDRTVLTKISKVETAHLENKLLGLFGVEVGADKKTAGEMPELMGVTTWLNSLPLTKADLKGQVVLIDFWTYSCINCIRTLPYVKDWYAKYKDQGLVVIGVHAPEFAFEKDIQNVEKAVKDLGVLYPVAIDNDFKVWNSFSNRYWPAHYFIDRQGVVRHQHFGEGEYETSEKWIRTLLEENGEKIKSEFTTVVSGEGAQAAGLLDKVKTPETYVGYDRAENFKMKPNIKKDEFENYSVESNLNLNEWGLQGKWKISSERAQSSKKKASVILRYHARDLHLVLGSVDNKKIKYRVTIDGKNPGVFHGVDTDENGFGVIDGHRMYQLIRAPQAEGIQDRTFKIEFLDEGAEAFAFTFG